MDDIVSRLISTTGKQQTLGERLAIRTAVPPLGAAIGCFSFDKGSFAALRTGSTYPLIVRFRIQCIGSVCLFSCRSRSCHVGSQYLFSCCFRIQRIRNYHLFSCRFRIMHVGNNDLFSCCFRNRYVGSCCFFSYSFAFCFSFLLPKGVDFRSRFLVVSALLSVA